MFVPGLDWITNAAIPSEARPLLQLQFLDPTPLPPSQVAMKGGVPSTNHPFPFERYRTHGQDLVCE